MSLQAFPKIFALGHKLIRNIFDDPVEITEKVDGSQFGFAKINGQLSCRSKGEMLNLSSPEKMFKEAVDHIKSIEARIPNNSRFWGEYLKKPKHNNLAYTRVPKNHIALFGYEIVSDSDWGHSHEELAGWASTFETEIVPRLYAGVADPDLVLKLLDTESFLGGVQIEGVVVKNYAKQILVGDTYYPIMCGKYVSEAYKEVAKGWKKEHTGKGKWGDYMDTFATTARWDKAIQHLRDSGLLIGAPQDIGNLIKRVQTDVMEECEDEIKEALWKFFGKDLIRNSIRGLAEWYKTKLLKGEI